MIRRALPAALVAGAAALNPSAASAATRTYIVTDFDSVRLEAPIAVAVQTRRGVSAHGDGDRDLLDRLDLNVSARVLTIRLKPSPFESGNADPAGTVRLFLSTPMLRRLQLDGAGTLAATGMNGQRAEIIAAGSGILSVAGVASDTLSVAQLGSGAVNLKGKAGNLVVRTSGTGTLDASELVASDLDFTADGAGTARLLATRSAKLVAIGPGSVTVDGNPACTVRHAGSGTVTCAGEDY